MYVKTIEFDSEGFDNDVRCGRAGLCWAVVYETRCGQKARARREYGLSVAIGPTNRPFLQVNNLLRDHLVSVR